MLLKVVKRSDGETFRLESASKSAAKRTLTRYNGYEYCSMWTFTEVDLNEWNKLKRDGVKVVPSKYYK